MTFDQYYRDNIRSTYFQSQELLVKGASHYRRGSAAFQLNTDPPMALWANCIELVHVLDKIRELSGSPLSLNSVYRSDRYNRAVGGASLSQHRLFKAADVTSRLTPRQIAAIAARLRAEGFFKGGIGIYPGFTHIDVRGKNVDW